MNITIPRVQEVPFMLSETCSAVDLKYPILPVDDCIDALVDVGGT